MSWTRKPRRPVRPGCRPGIDRLESRNLLSAAASALGPTFDAMVGASATRADYHVDGSGLAAAVIDTGVNYRHDALGDGYGAGRKVLGGYDLGDDDADPDASTWQHGTAVAGLIAASSAEDVGVAPGAGIVALRVFDSSNQGGYDKIADALQWVIDHHESHHITVVNLSVSDGKNYTRDGFPFDSGIANRLKGLIAQLKAMNIPVVAATGNSFSGQQGMGFTAIMRDTISVTASDPGDHLLANAQRLGTAIGGELATDLAAPGSGLKAPADGESYSSVEGTSFAAPVVSGAIVLLQSIYKQRFGALPSVDQLNDWLKRGADTITDATTGITLPRLNIARSASLVPAAPTPDTPPPAEPPGAPAEPPQTVEIFHNGTHVGTVAEDSPQNPLRDAFEAFGLTGSFRTIHTWSANQNAADAGRTEATGTTVKIPSSGRRARAGADRLGQVDDAVAAFRNRASLLRSWRTAAMRARPLSRGTFVRDGGPR
jgi:subtilisin family serine protease